MRPTLPRPSPDQTRSMAALRKSTQWEGFDSWLTECYEAAIERTLTCDDKDLVPARSMASALRSIRESLETAPEIARETARE